MRVMQKLRYQLSIKAVKRTLDQLVGVRIPVPQFILQLIGVKICCQ
jgi:hypothetical protein